MSFPVTITSTDNAYQIRLEQEIRGKEKYDCLFDAGIDPLTLLRYNRFDIAAKLIFIKNKNKNTNCSFSQDVYRQHLKVWNNFYENNPKKEKYSDFVNSFKKLFDSIQANGFRESSKVPVLNGLAINGAHRIASSIFLGTNLYTKPSDRDWETTF